MNRISDDVIRRLPRYLRKLDDMYEKGERRVSSGQISRQLGLAPSQFRQDLALFGDFKQQALAYDIDEIRNALGRILGTYEDFSAILIGTGKLGSTLLEHFEFIIDGYSVLGAFDASPANIGRTINGVPVYDSAGLGDFLKENKVDIAIMTIPRTAAQSVADVLVENGVSAIWNFTNTDLDVHDADVLVENVHFSDSLLALNYYLAKKREDGGKD